LREEGVRNLHENAGAVAGARIGADRAAMFEVAENVDRVGDDLMRLLALDVGDEADAAGILLHAEVVHALGRRAPVMFTLRSFRQSVGRFRSRGRRQRFCHEIFALEFRPAHRIPLNQAKGLTASSAHLGRLRHPPGHRSSAASRNFLNSGLGVQRP